MTIRSAHRVDCSRVTAADARKEILDGLRANPLPSATQGAERRVVGLDDLVGRRIHEQDRITQLRGDVLVAHLHRMTGGQAAQQRQYQPKHRTAECNEQGNHSREHQPGGSIPESIDVARKPGREQGDRDVIHVPHEGIAGNVSRVLGQHERRRRIASSGQPRPHRRRQRTSRLPFSGKVDHLHRQSREDAQPLDVGPFDQTNEQHGRPRRLGAVRTLDFDGGDHRQAVRRVHEALRRGKLHQALVAQELPNVAQIFDRRRRHDFAGGAIVEPRKELAAAPIDDPNDIDAHRAECIRHEVRGDEPGVAVVHELDRIVPLRILAIAELELARICFERAIDLQRLLSGNRGLDLLEAGNERPRRHGDADAKCEQHAAAQNGQGPNSPSASARARSGGRSGAHRFHP